MRGLQSSVRARAAVRRPAAMGIFPKDRDLTRSHVRNSRRHRANQVPRVGRGADNKGKDLVATPQAPVLDRRQLREEFARVYTR